MNVYFHDNSPAKPGEQHGPDGPTHCGSVEVDYAYQAEQWVIDIGTDNPKIVYARCPELRRAWRRKGDTKEFEEVPYIDGPPSIVHA